MVFSEVFHEKDGFDVVIANPPYIRHEAIKHMKPSRKYSQGGIIDKEAPIHRSNVSLICPKCDKPTRIGHKILDSGVKMRMCKKCSEVID